MINFRKSLFLLLIFFVLHPDLSGADTQDAFGPVALYLTWQSDPTTTMTVHWHTNWKEGFRDPILQYRKEGADDWKFEIGTWDPMPFSENRLVHTVELTRLQPDRVYEFRFGRTIAEDNVPFSLKEGDFEFKPDSETYTFRTMPADVEEPVTFVMGADTHGPQHVERYRNMSRQVAKQNPYFAAIAGDIAYADGDPARIDYWYRFFDIWKEEMVTEAGHLIPVLPTHGNHDVHGNAYDSRSGRAHPNRSPFLPRLFAGISRDRTYDVLDFEDYLSIVLLDADHSTAVDGEQARWLEDVLLERQNTKFVFPIYHTQGYTAARDFDRPVETKIRETWSPLFEDNRVRAVFEGHDHTYKRTPPIRRNEIDPEGVVYFNSAWGASPRTPHDPEETWYLEEAASKNCVVLVTLSSGEAVFRALSIEGEIFDEYVISH